MNSKLDETLDNPDWDGMRMLGHRIVDDAVAYLQSVRERAAWQPIPAAVRKGFDEPAPLEPRAPADVYNAVRERILPYPTGNIHPRFWGWVMGTGTLTGAYAELIAATMNANVSGFDDAASAVELQVIGWLRDLLGFPGTSTGLLVSGGSMANLVGLTVARNARAGFDVRREGLGAAPQPLRVYASTQVHNSVKKAVELLGLGRDSLRLVAVGGDYTLALDALEAAIAEDRVRGARPFCVVANCGTVATGALDDLEALASLCEREGLWLHVDGAFGALAALSPELRSRVRGLERADSLAFDLHKWGYVPYEAGCILVRDGHLQREAFAVAADYLAPAGGGVAPRGTFLADQGPQLSRGFRALKVWMALQEHGAHRLGRLVHQNVEQAAYLAERIGAEAELELMAPVPLNVVCFRYRGAAAAQDWDSLNRELLVRLQQSGIAVPSHTLLEGRYALRVAITNHRSRRDDFDLLVSEVLRLGRSLVAQGRTAAAS
jgi:aromatic-L-amino-acid/L-tryptophan decarboxylase